MPKITPIDALQHKIANPIKANTNANPVKHVPKTTEAPVQAAEPTGQTPNAEGQGSEAKETLDPKYEALAKKESEFLAKEKEFKARELEVDQKLKDAAKTALEEFKSQLKQSPLDVLNDLGLTYDDLVQQAVNQPDPELKSVKSKVEALEKRLSEAQETAQKREAAQRESAITQIRNDAKALVESDPELETIKTTGRHEDIVQHIVKHFDEHGTLLTVEEAAKQIESKLFEEALKVAGTAKVKAKLTPEVVEAAKQDIPKQQPQIKTLTNNISSSKPLSARERALLAFEGKLK